MLGGRKKVTVVLDSTGDAPEGTPFDFAGFDPGAHQAAFNPRAPADSPQDEPLTAFQAEKKASIVPGMNQADLLKMHRQSLAQLAGSRQTDFCGITLSRRHQIKSEDYEAPRQLPNEDGAALESFKFGE